MSQRSQRTEPDAAASPDPSEEPPFRSGGDVVSALADIRAVADGWIARHADQFDPFVWTDLDERHLRRKAFTEAALYLYVADELGAGDAAPALRDLVVDRANDPRYHHLVRRHPREFLKYSHPMSYAKARGVLSADGAAVVEGVLDGQTPWAVERVPHRLMDLWHFCTVYGYDRCPFAPDELLRLGTLNYPPDVVEADLSDAYALTHNLLYYHNFGVPHPSFPSDPAPYDLGEALTGLVLRFMAADNCDVVLELLVVGVLQRQLPPDLVGIAVSWIAERAGRRGYVPGPEQEDPAVDVESWGEAEREWAQHYHTNLVAATAARAMTRAWPAFLGSDAASNDPRTDAEDVARLGRLLATLADYNLQSAARQMAGLARSPVVGDGAYAAVFADAVAFLRRQEAGTGHYGFWTDEAEMYRALGNDPEAFLPEVIGPVTDACTAALDGVGSRTRR